MSSYALDKQRSAVLITTTATQKTLFVFTPPSPGLHLLEAIVMATKPDYSVAAVWSLQALIKITASGGTPILLGSVSDLLNDKKDKAASAWDASIAISGQTVLVLVSGAAGTSINWLCYFGANTFTP